MDGGGGVERGEARGRGDAEGGRVEGLVGVGGGGGIGDGGGFVGGCF